MGKAPFTFYSRIYVDLRRSRCSTASGCARRTCLMSSLILSAALSTFPYTSWVRLMILPAQIHSIASTNTHQTCVNSHPVNCIVVSFCITNRPSSNYLPILYGKRSLPPSSVFTLTGGSPPSLAWPLPAQTGLDLPATPSLGLRCRCSTRQALPANPHLP